MTDLQKMEFESPLYAEEKINILQDEIKNINPDSIKKSNNKKEHKDNSIRVSFLEWEYEGKKYLAEEVYDHKNGIRFAVWGNGKVDYKTKITLFDTEYKPISGVEVINNFILLPENAEDYGEEEYLVVEIKSFCKKWVVVSESFYDVVVWYILTSWVYDKFDTINYLRALGDTGTGKSRFLDCIGGLCYKYISISGAVTPAAMYRLIGKWKGTIGIEEADLKESDETNEVIKILNCGFERGKPIIRCDKDNSNALEFHDAFGPKIIATRRSFSDAATEARCLTERMEENRGVADTKTKEFFAERQRLRNKLLMFRFKNYHSVNIEKALDIDLSNLEPRLRQASRPFLALIWNKPKLLEDFKNFLQNYNRELIIVRSTSWTGLIVNAIAELIINNRENDLTATTIAETTNHPKMTSRSVGKELRNLKLKIESKWIDGYTRKLLEIDKDKLNIIFSRYVEDENVSQKLKKMGFFPNYRITNITDILDTMPNNAGVEKCNNNNLQESLSNIGNFGNSEIENGQKPLVETIQDDITIPIDILDWDKKLVVFMPCSVAFCPEFECNFDGKNKPYCQGHWQKEATK